MAGPAKATLEQRLRAIPQPGIREIALRTVAATLRPNTVELRTDSIITLTEYLAAHHPHVHSLIPLTRAHMEGFLAYNHGRPWRGRVARSQPVSPVVSKRTAVNVRYRGVFAYIDGQLPDGTVLPLCRLRYDGSASIWGFAIYLASRDGYEDNFLPSGLPAGSPEELSTAPAACTSTTPPPGCNPRRINGEGH
jgi:hypothetical protein